MTSSGARPPPLPLPLPDDRDDDLRDDLRLPRRARSTWVVWLVVGVLALVFLVPFLGPRLWRDIHFEGDRAARTQMAVFAQAIDYYRTDRKELPGTLNDLVTRDSRRPYGYLDLDRVPLDPWGNEYEYRVLDRTTYEIQCAGEDQLLETEDDLFHPRRGE